MNDSKAVFFFSKPYFFIKMGIFSAFAIDNFFILCYDIYVWKFFNYKTERFKEHDLQQEIH